MDFFHTPTPPLFHSRISDAVNIRINRTDLVRHSIVGQHLEYIIEINETSGEKSTVSKRYSKFLELNCGLNEMLQYSSVPFPEIPPRRVFGNFDPDFIEERRLGLEQYLQLLLKHPYCCIADDLWLFLDADDSAIIAFRFLGPLKREVDVLHAIEELNNLFFDKLNFASNVNRLSQDLILDRLVEFISLENALILNAACLTLTEICLRCPKSRQSLAALNVLSSMFVLLEKFPNDAALTVACREFIFGFISVYQLSLILYFRTQNGIPQLLRIAKNVSLSLFHSFIVLLLWLSIHDEELQAALTEPEGTGMDILGYLYSSPNATARLLCGLVVSVLILKKKFNSSSIILQAARSVGLLPAELATSSCRRKRWSLFFPQEKEEEIDLAVGSLCPSESRQQQQKKILDTASASTSVQTIIESINFKELDLYIRQKDRERFYYRRPSDDKQQSDQEQAGLFSSNASSGSGKQLEEHRQSFNNKEANFSVDIHEIDYCLLYMSCCSAGLAHRVFDALQLSVTGVVGSNTEAAVAATDDESSECRQNVCNFILWVINLLVSPSKHTHKTNFYRLHKDRLGNLSCGKSATTLESDIVSRDGSNDPSSVTCYKGVNRTCNENKREYLTVKQDECPCCKNILSDEKQLYWNLSKDLRVALFMEVTASEDVPIGHLSPTISNKQPDSRDGDLGITTVASNSNETENQNQQQQGNNDLAEVSGRFRFNYDTTTSMKEKQSSSPLSTAAIPALMFSCKLGVHVNTDISIHNHYLLRYIGVKFQIHQPWQTFISDVPNCLTTLEFILERSRSEACRIYAASILLNIPCAAVPEETAPPLSSNGSANNNERSQRMISPVVSTTLDGQIKGEYSHHDTKNECATSFDMKHIDGRSHIVYSYSENFGKTASTPVSRSIYKTPFNSICQTKAGAEPVGSDLGSSRTGRTAAATFVLKNLQLKEHFEHHRQDRPQTAVPPVEFIIPQGLLHQRMTGISVLLKYSESSIEDQREQLKLGEWKLQSEDSIIQQRQTVLQLTEATINEYLNSFKTYVFAKNTLKDLAELSMSFITGGRNRLEIQALKKTGLTVSKNAAKTELTKLSTATEHLFDIHAEVTQHAVALSDARSAADEFLKALLELNAELRRTQEAYKSVKRDVQQKRNRWIEMEQQIAEVPERRRKLTEQLSHKEQKEEEANKKVAAVERELEEAEASYSSALEETKKTQTTRYNIEGTILEKWGASAENEVQQRQQQQSVKESALTSSEFDGTTKRLESDSNSPLLQIQENLPTQGNNSRDGLKSPASLVACEPRIMGLRDQLKKAEGERKKRSAETERVRAGIQLQTDLEQLVKKSTDIQNEVRKLDAEAQKLGTDVEALENKVRQLENELETKKTGVRTCEQKFFKGRDSLLRLIQNSNGARQSLFKKILDTENNLKIFLSAIAGDTEDSGYTVLNRGLLHLTLASEARSRAEFRQKTKALISLLENVERTLEQIDDSTIRTDTFFA